MILIAPMSISTKKLDELKYAKFFIDQINRLHSFDYEAVINENEGKNDSDVDIYGVSRSGKFKKINLQMITREGYLRKCEAELRKISKQTGANVAMSNDLAIKIEEDVKEAITKKEEKKYSEQNKLILLITSEIDPLINEQYARKEFARGENSDFAGIYLVHLPSQPGESSHPHDGQIIAIKNIDFSVFKI